jgi:hypothetical protein
LNESPNSIDHSSATEGLRVVEYDNDSGAGFAQHTKDAKKTVRESTR